MTALFGLLTLGLAIFVLFNLAVGLFSRARRKRKFRMALGGFCAMVASLFAFSHFDNLDAIAEGFASSTDRIDAKKAGVTAPARWLTLKAEEAARQEARLKADEEVRRQAAEMEAKETAERAKLATEEKAAKKADEEAAELARRGAEEVATREAAKEAAERAKRLAEETAAKKAAEDAEERLKAAACRNDIKCWGEEAWPGATVRCPSAVESLAQWDYEWTDSWSEVKFDRYRWKDQKAGVVTFYGDKIKMQNGFGAWKHVSYSCDYDPISEKVLNAAVFE